MMMISIAVALNIIVTIVMSIIIVIIIIPSGTLSPNSSETAPFVL